MIALTMRFLLVLGVVSLVACGSQVPEYDLTEPTIEQNLKPGSSIRVPVSINRLGGFNESVRVSLVSPPTGISASSVIIEPQKNSATLTINASERASSGALPLTIRTVSPGAAIKLATLRLNVGEEPALKCVLDRPRVRVAQNSSTTIKVKLERRNFNEAVIVAFTALPAGLRGSNTVIPGGQTEAALEITAQGNAGLTTEPALTTVSVTSARFGTELLKLELDVIPGSGNLDSSFGVQGKVITSVSSAADVANAMTAQADGKIVVVGSSQGQFAVLRYNRDGGPDVGFGVGGLRLTEFDTNAEALAVAVQPDAKIVVAGRAGKRFALARYRSNGTPDTGFGNAGQVMGALEADVDNTFYALGVQSDGKILAAGTSHGRAVLARYSSDGSPDSGFGTDGYAVLDIVGNDERAYALALQSDGKIIVAGRAAGSVGLFVARFNADGLLDPDFGTGGATTRALGTSLTAARAIALQPEGKIVLAGFADYGAGGSNTLIARVLTDGSFDPSFGTGGIVQTDLREGKHDYAYALAVQPDGKLITAGNAVNQTGDGLEFALVRYQSSGDLDEGFGLHGVSLASLGVAGLRANAAVLQPGGIVVGGNTGIGSDQDVVLARFIR